MSPIPLLGRFTFAKVIIVPIIAGDTVVLLLAGTALVAYQFTTKTRMMTDKVAETATVAAPSAAAAVWTFDADAGETVLGAIGADKDFAYGTILDRRGELFAEATTKGRTYDSERLSNDLGTTIDAIAELTAGQYEANDHVIAIRWLVAGGIVW